MITLEPVEDLFAMLSFLPVVTEIAKVAASLKRPNILPAEDVTDLLAELGELSSSNDYSTLSVELPPG